MYVRLTDKSCWHEISQSHSLSLFFYFSFHPSIFSRVRLLYLAFSNTQSLCCLAFFSRCHCINYNVTCSLLPFLKYFHTFTNISKPPILPRAHSTGQTGDGDAGGNWVFLPLLSHCIPGFSVFYSYNFYIPPLPWFPPVANVKKTDEAPRYM